MMQRTRDWIGACDWLKKFQGQVTTNQRDVKDLSKATSHMTIQGNVIYIFFLGGGDCQAYSFREIKFQRVVRAQRLTNLLSHEIFCDDSILKFRKSEIPLRIWRTPFLIIHNLFLGHQIFVMLKKSEKAKISRNSVHCVTSLEVQCRKIDA